MTKGPLKGLLIFFKANIRGYCMMKYEESSLLCQFFRLYQDLKEINLI